MSNHQSTRKSKQPAKNSPVQHSPVEQSRSQATLEQIDPAAMAYAAANLGRARPDDVLQLQRAYGNRAVAGLIQAKLVVGPANDRYEQEADRMADYVVKQAGPVAPATVASASAQRKGEDEEELQAKLTAQPQVGLEGGSVSTEIETAIQRARGGGQPLAGDIKPKMEQAFGFDFSGVRVHSDTQADRLNQSIQAKAFTTGQDIFFRQGAYDPGNSEGQRLIAHELTHVVQQGGTNLKRAVNLRPTAINVSSAPFGKVQRLIPREKLGEIEKKHRFSKTYPKILDGISDYEKATQEALPKDSLYTEDQRNPIVGGKLDKLSEQLNKLVILSEPKVKSHPQLKRFIPDAETEMFALQSVFTDDQRGEKYGATIADAIKLKRVEMGSPYEKFYEAMDVGEDPVVEQEADKSADSKEKEEVSEAEIEALPDKDEAPKADKDAKKNEKPDRLDRLWKWFKKKISQFDEFMENLTDGLPGANLTWKIVKAVGKLVFFLLKSGLKTIGGPIIKIIQVLRGKEKFFAENRKIFFNLNNYTTGWIWAIFEFINDWLGSITSWSGWVSVITGLIGIIPGAQVALAISTISGGINVIAGMAKAAVTTVQTVALAVAKKLGKVSALVSEKVAENKKKLKTLVSDLVKRLFGDLVNVALTGVANAVTSLSGGGDKGFFGELQAAMDPKLQAGAIANTTDLAKVTAGTTIVSDQLGAEALKQNVYLGSNAVGGDWEAIVKEVGTLKTNLVKFLSRFKPIAILFGKINSMGKTAMNGVRWFIKTVGKLFTFVKGLFGGQTSTATETAPKMETALEQVNKDTGDVSKGLSNFVKGVEDISNVSA
jgi:hypothetical protein